MRILITRHGQTDWNLQKKVQGRADISLNENGKNEAKEIHNKLKDERIDLIISSPLDRTRETSELIRGDRDIPIILDERIIERSFGINEGKNKNDFEFYDFWDYEKNIEIEGAEKIQDFFDRIYKFLDEIKEKYKDKNILLVSHAGVSIVLRCYLNGIERKDAREKVERLKNCEVDIYDI